MVFEPAAQRCALDRSSYSRRLRRKSTGEAKYFYFRKLGGGLREKEVVKIESEWTPRDRERQATGSVEGTLLIPEPALSEAEGLAPKIGARTWATAFLPIYLWWRTGVAVVVSMVLVPVAEPVLD